MAEEYDDLIGRYVHGDATQEDLAELSRVLERHPEIIQRFLAAAELERDLREVYGTQAVVAKSQTKAVAVARISRKSRRRRAATGSWVLPAAGVAAVIAIAAAFVLSARGQGSVIAHVASAVRGAIIIRGGEEFTLEADSDIRIGDKLKVPARATVNVDFPDRTRMTVGSASNDETVALFDEYSQPGAATGTGKKIRLDSGVMTAEVSPQPKGRPMLVTTSRATAEVVGTQLKVSVENEATRLDVLEGKVRLRRLSDFAVADVSGGEYLVASKDADFQPRAIPPEGRIIVTCDDRYELYLNGVKLGQREFVKGTWFFDSQTYDVGLLKGKNTIAIRGGNIDNIAGLIAEIQVGNQRYVTNSSWRVSKTEEPGWNTVNFNDSRWAGATEYGSERSERPKKHAKAARFPMDSEAAWIWSDANMFVPGKDSENTVFFRFSFDFPPPVTKSGK
jgi:ferric-dicitrate binding protein FerR (iron transport regulator)